MLGFLTPLIVKAATFAGAKIFQAIGGHHIAPTIVGIPSALWQGIGGLGVRFLAGMGFAFYLQNEKFREGVNTCIAAIKDAIIP